MVTTKQALTTLEVADWPVRVVDHFRLCILLIGLTLLGGCSGLQQQRFADDFDRAWRQGDFDSLAMSLGGSDSDPEGDLLLWWLHEAETQRLAGVLDDSLASYGQAEAEMIRRSRSGATAMLGQTVMETLVNDSAADYQPLVAESILVNTYKALTFLMEGERADARVEFNRVDDRTRRAIDQFSESIIERRENLSTDSRAARAADNTLSDARFQQQLRQNYGDPGQWQVLSEFMVPVSTWLHGLYFMAAAQDRADLERSRVSLQRVAKILGGPPALAEDAQLAEALAAGDMAVDDVVPLVWVLYEKGLGPVPEAVSFDFALPVSSRGGFVYVPLSLPRFAERPTAMFGAGVSTCSENFALEPMSELGAVIKTEMQARFPGVLARAVTRATVNGFLQYEASDRLGLAGFIASLIYTVANSAPDLRGWRALPEGWSMTRLPRPDNGKLALQLAGGQEQTLQLPAWPFTLVYIKQPTSAATPVVWVIDLSGSNPGLASALPEESATSVTSGSNLCTKAL